MRHDFFRFFYPDSRVRPKKEFGKKKDLAIFASFESLIAMSFVPLDWHFDRDVHRVVSNRHDHGHGQDGGDGDGDGDGDGCTHLTSSDHDASRIGPS
jgi:hypothetical protein